MTALVFLALAQAPSDVPVAIVISSRRDTANAAPAVVEQLKVALAAQGIAATGDADSVARFIKLGGVEPKACDGARLCLQKLAQLLQGVVIGVDVSKAGKLTAGHLEAVGFDRVDSLAADDLTSDAKQWNKKAAEAATAFAEKLKAPIAALNDARKKKAQPAPVAQNELKGTPALEPPREQPKLTPEPPLQPPQQPPPEAVAVEQKGGGLGPVPYITTAGAIAFGGAGIVLLILGFLDRGAYWMTTSDPDANNKFASSKTDAELRALANESNVFIGVGAGLVGLGVAVGITSALLFLKE